MTTVGCSLLLFTMFGLIGLLFAGRMFDPRDSQQKQSETAGFVLFDDQFDGPLLNSQGRETMTEIIENYERRSATILLEGDPLAAELIERRAAVVQELAHRLDGLARISPKLGGRVAQDMDAAGAIPASRR